MSLLNDEKFIELLLEKKAASRKVIDNAKKIALEQDLTLEKALIKNKIVDEEELAKIKAIFFNIDYVDLREEHIPQEILNQIPEEAASHYRFVSFFSDNEKIKVAQFDLEDQRAQEALRFFTWQRGKKIETYICSEASFRNAFKQYHIINTEVKKALEDIQSAIKKPQAASSAAKTSEILIEEAPVSKIVDMILRSAVDARASDIHIEPVEGKLRIRNRVDGVLQTNSEFPESLQLSIVSRIKILSNLKIDEQRKPQDGRFQVNLGGKLIDFRVSTLPTSKGEKIALRILDKDQGIQNLENMGMGVHYRRLILENIRKPFGAILVSGPTGSGKSTTIYTLLSVLNQDGTNIITLEDPIEYYINGVNQSQIRPEIGYTFASGLRSILRQDPDVISVGEIRDKETAELVVHAALTGHLVLSTIHTNSAIGVIPRLVDMGVEPFLIASSLNIAVAQRLVKKICKYCKEEYAPSLEVEKKILKEISQISVMRRKEIGEFIEKRPLKLYRGVGCKRCLNKGTRGRIGLYEILEVTKDLAKIITDGASQDAILKESLRQDMITIRQAGIIKAVRGDVLVEEVLEVSKGEEE
ncbi:GspE/PulE family protein [Patescibacteria group bacterium]|nr:GspE/PulE family protein [Patescibacteria group bacterium]